MPSRYIIVHVVSQDLDGIFIRRWYQGIEVTMRAEWIECRGYTWVEMTQEEALVFLLEN